MLALAIAPSALAGNYGSTTIVNSAGGGSCGVNAVGIGTGCSTGYSNNAVTFGVLSPQLVAVPQLAALPTTTTTTTTTQETTTPQVQTQASIVALPSVAVTAVPTYGLNTVNAVNSVNTYNSGVGFASGFNNGGYGNYNSGFSVNTVGLRSHGFNNGFNRGFNSGFNHNVTVVNHGAGFNRGFASNRGNNVTVINRGGGGLFGGNGLFGGRQRSVSVQKSRVVTRGH